MGSSETPPPDNLVQVESMERKMADLQQLHQSSYARLEQHRDQLVADLERTGRSLDDTRVSMHAW